MAKKIVAVHKKTGGKYVTCIQHPKHKSFYKVQTARAKETGSFWYVKAKDIEIK